ncbi:MAG: DUF4859 domain-containing protein, partial [Prevotellaceae bacterium]|nr:DUF4859 domain-containing protein [Prevotellaceae bacterium]
PGFWLTADGYVKAWGDDTYWGVSTAVTSSADALIFQCIQYPHLSADGDTYKGTFYLINRETGDYLTVILTYTIGEVTNYEEVGGESIYVPLSEDDNYVDFDMDEVLDALGVDIDELADSYCLCAKSGNTSTAMLDAGLYFDADGLCVGSNEDYSATFWFESRTDGWKLFTTGIDLEEGETITTTFYIQIDGMRWTVDITFMNTKDYETGVNTVAADKAGSSAIYDLSGRQVSKAQKGIYVTDGKKYIVK